MNFDKDFDLVIVGAGPAGLTAAIYASRANLSVCFIDKDAPGGKVVTTAFVENYPGYENISGPDLSLKFFDQAKKLGAKFIFSEVKNIDVVDEYKYTELSNGNTIRSKVVIIATGMVNRKIGCINEVQMFGKGVSYCAICDGAIYKDQHVAVIGSGLSAIEESLYMSDIASKVTLISNKEKFKVENDKSTQHLFEKTNIEILYNTETISFNGNDKLKSITLKDKTTNKQYDLEVAGAFIFIGFIPICPTVNNNSILDPISKFINVDSKMETIVPGIFAAGDIVNKKIRQISTAIGDGTIAALSAADYISEKLWK